MPRIDPPAGLSPWLPNYAQVAPIASYPGNFFVDTSRVAFSIPTQLNNGVSYLLVNEGQPVEQYEDNYADLPVSRRAKILNAAELRGRGKWFQDYQDGDSDNLINGIVVKQAECVESEMGEAEHEFARQYPTNPTQFVRIDQGLSAKYPGRYFSEYAGCMNEYTGLTSGNRAALQSDSNALSYMKTPKDQGGGVYYLMPYFVIEAYKWGQQVISNLYHNGSWNGQFLLRFMLHMVIPRMAGRAAGYPNIVIMGMTEGLDNETNIGTAQTGFSCVYVRPLPNGGRVKAHHGFTPTQFDALACAHFLAGLIGRASHKFGPRTFSGTDEMAIGPLNTDRSSPLYFDYDASGSNGNQPNQNAEINQYYKVQPGKVYAYARQPRGQENGCAYGHDCSQIAKNYVGNEDWYFPVITLYKADGTTQTFTPGPGATMIATCYDNGLPQALFGMPTDGSKKRWYWYQYQARDGQPETIRCKFTMNGVDSPIYVVTSGIFCFYTF